MKKPIWERKIPTLAGIIMIAVGVLVTSYLANITGVGFFQHAAPPENPTNVRITNVTDNSFTVTYQTTASVTGSITLKGDSSQTVLDERDQTAGIPKPYMLHSISVKNLKPKTTYAFSITSGATTYDNNGASFSLTTGPSLSASPSSQTPFTGSVINPDGTTPSEALIFATATNGQPLSTLVRQNGIYILPVNIMRTVDLGSYLTFNTASVVQLLAVGDTITSQVNVSLSATNPLPVITLSKNYDFTQSSQPLASTSASPGFPNFGLSSGTVATPEILTPETNQGFTDQQPQFAGKAPANTKVEITIHSPSAIQTQVTADSNGNWTYRPTQPLSPGNHTITITAPNASGIMQTIEQSFVVYASGSQFDTVGTPTPTPASNAATPTMAPSPTIASPTPKPKQTATITPTTTTSNSSTDSGQGVASPTSATSSPTIKPSLPPTGSNDTIIGTFFGVITTIIGIGLFLLTRTAAL